jgi:hypothetical protein
MRYVLDFIELEELELKSLIYPLSGYKFTATTPVWRAD